LKSLDQLQDSFAALTAPLRLILARCLAPVKDARHARRRRAGCAWLRDAFIKQAGMEIGEAEDTLKHDVGRMLLHPIAPVEGLIITYCRNLGCCNVPSASI
jgi:hypothetical protein